MAKTRNTSVKMPALARADSTISAGNDNHKLYNLAVWKDIHL